MIFRNRRLYQLMPAALAAAVVLASSLPAQAATTTVGQTISPGLLTLTAPASATLPPAQTDADADGSSQGSLGSMQVNDSRGTYAGWSLTATSSNFSQIKSPMPSRTGAPTVTSSGAYTGNLNGQYTITITTGGSLGTAQFQFNGPENDGPKTIPAGGTIALGIKGVVLNFGAGTYQVGDKWTVEADTMPASGVMVTPANLTTLDGSPSGVHLGAVYQFSSTTDSATLLTADSGSGFGLYSATPTLRLTIPARTPVGAYTATITETLN
jgi:hypothetical protein